MPLAKSVRAERLHESGRSALLVVAAATGWWKLAPGGQARLAADEKGAPVEITEAWSGLYGGESKEHNTVIRT